MQKSQILSSLDHHKRSLAMINISIYNNASNSDTFLEGKDYVKFLGVLIDKNLTWTIISTTLPLNLAGLLELRHSVLLNTLIQIYSSLIFPYTYYRTAAWGQEVELYALKNSPRLRDRREMVTS